jgi:hypothetical protein
MPLCFLFSALLPPALHDSGACLFALREAARFLRASSCVAYLLLPPVLRIVGLCRGRFAGGTLASDISRLPSGCSLALFLARVSLCGGRAC